MLTHHQNGTESRCLRCDLSKTLSNEGNVENTWMKFSDPSWLNETCLIRDSSLTGTGSYVSWFQLLIVMSYLLIVCCSWVVFEDLLDSIPEAWGLGVAEVLDLLLLDRCWLTSHWFLIHLLWVNWACGSRTLTGFAFWWLFSWLVAVEVVLEGVESELEVNFLNSLKVLLKMIVNLLPRLMKTLPLEEDLESERPESPILLLKQKSWTSILLYELSW